MHRIVRHAASTAILVAAACSSGGSPTPQNDVGVPSGALVASVASVALGSGVPAVTFTVSEPGYVGLLSASIACAPRSGVASISPSTVDVRTSVSIVAFAVAQGGVPGTCAIVISDARANSLRIAVTATARTPVVAVPTELALTVGGARASLAVSESGYGGTFFATGCPAGIVLVAPSDAAVPSLGRPATFEIIPQGVGTCTLSVADAGGDAARIAIDVAP